MEHGFLDKAATRDKTDISSILSCRAAALSVPLECASALITDADNRTDPPSTLFPFSFHRFPFSFLGWAGVGLLFLFYNPTCFFSF
jgi:hypothetical protein